MLSMMMRGLVVRVLLLGASGCRPSQGRVDALEQHVVGLGAEQRELAAQLEQADAEMRELSAQVDQRDAELLKARSLAEDLSLRVAVLEEHAPKPAVAKPANGSPGHDERFLVPIGDAHARGPTDALVTIVAFSDFQCPFCRRANPTIRAVEAQHKGKVRFVFMHNPLEFHKQALNAALAAEAAGRQGKFWKLHDLLFDNAKELSVAKIEKLARKAGVKRNRFRRDLKAPELKAKVQAQRDLAARIGARGTPTFFINGRPLVGAVPLERFNEMIEEELSIARSLVEDGTPSRDVYDTLMRDARPSK